MSVGRLAEQCGRGEPVPSRHGHVAASADAEGRRRHVRVLAATLSLGAVAALVVACAGASPKPLDPPPGKPAHDATCPDLSKPDELAALDFAKEYGLAAGVADKLKVGLLTAMDVSSLADRLDGDFGIACAQIAHDLGAKGDWRSGNDACEAAVRAMEEARAKIGPKAQLRLVARTPLCLADPALITKCASLCDGTTPAEKVRAECEQTAGRCDGSCDGTCEPRSPVKCEGVCSGACEGPMKGTCGGRCKGTCDGKPSAGACLGVCVGTCERGVVSGECKGTCSGGCRLAKAGICDGVCVGACSVELSETRCAGGIKEPEVNADCSARCELEGMDVMSCTAPQVGLVVAGANSREAADALKAAIDKSFPAVLKIQGELGERATTVVSRAAVVIENARKTLHDSGRVRGADAATLTRCFDATLEKGVKSTAAVKASVERGFALRNAAMQQ